MGMDKHGCGGGGTGSFPQATDTPASAAATKRARRARISFLTSSAGIVSSETAAERIARAAVACGRSGVARHLPREARTRYRRDVGPGVGRLVGDREAWCRRRLVFDLLFPAGDTDPGDRRCDELR